MKLQKCNISEQTKSFTQNYQLDSNVVIVKTTTQVPREWKTVSWLLNTSDTHTHTCQYGTL